MGKGKAPSKKKSGSGPPKSSGSGNGKTGAKSAPTTSRAERKHAAQRAERRAKIRWWTLGGVGVIALGAIVVVSFTGSQGGSGETEANAWDLPQLDGDGRVTLADFEGRPVVANFFASWCTECDRELPEFLQAAQNLDGEVDFVFINSNETGSWEPMAQRHGLVGNYPLAEDVAGNARNGLYRSLGGTQGMPMTAFYDENGEVVDVARGALVDGALDDRIRQLYGLG